MLYFYVYFFYIVSLSLSFCSLHMCVTCFNKDQSIKKLIKIENRVLCGIKSSLNVTEIALFSRTHNELLSALQVSTGFITVILHLLQI